MSGGVLGGLVLVGVVSLLFAAYGAFYVALCRWRAGLVWAGWRADLARGAGLALLLGFVCAAATALVIWLLGRPLSRAARDVVEQVTPLLQGNGREFLLALCALVPLGTLIAATGVVWGRWIAHRFGGLFQIDRRFLAQGAFGAAVAPMLAYGLTGTLVRMIGPQELAVLQGSGFLVALAALAIGALAALPHLTLTLACLRPRVRAQAAF